MIRKILLPACLAALLATACTGDSQLPDPTGKGSVRAINAIPGSPSINFRIGERSLGTVSYKASTVPALYDDFDYDFNFDISVPGETVQQRIASVPFKVEVDSDHVFVVSGDLASPTVTTWTVGQRTWQDSDTVFEARFAHLGETMGDIDVFFDDPANPPAAGAQVATLSYGDVMDPADFAEGAFRVTITTAGDPGALLFQSDTIDFVARDSHLLSIFDGNANDTGPYIVSSMSRAGLATNIVDPSFPPTINFVHAAQTLQAVDVYGDEALTDLLASNISVGESSGDVDTESGSRAFFFTPTGSIATTLFSSEEAVVAAGRRLHFYIVGPTDAWQVVPLLQDRAPSSVAAKISLFNGSLNHDLVDLYVLERGASLGDDDVPAAFLIADGFTSPVATRAAGSYDAYVTSSNSRTVLGGPFEIEAALGDVFFLTAVDDVDPEIVRIIEPFAAP